MANTKETWTAFSAEQKIKFFEQNTEDCSILVGVDGEEPKELRSFKFILSSVSPVFDKMFYGDSKEAKNTDPVRIKDILANDFETFLNYAYGRQTLIKNWKNLYDVAKKYSVSKMIASIINDLKNKKTMPHESVQLFEIMYIEKILFPIQKQTLNGKTVYNKELASIIKAFDVNCNYIFGLSFKIFFELIKKFKSYIAPGKIFQAVDRYCSIESNFASESVKFNLMNLLIEEIDFDKMTVQEFLKYVVSSALMSQTAKYSILINICRNM